LPGEKRAFFSYCPHWKHVICRVYILKKIPGRGGVLNHINPIGIVDYNSALTMSSKKYGIQVHYKYADIMRESK
jgi:hypothetical protein